jgi:hypothetical protein
MIYIDHLKTYPKGKFSHMVSDVSLAELHSFAKEIGVHRCWFENKERHPHYDVNEFYFQIALRHGAKLVSSKEIIRVIKNRRLFT